MKLHNVAAAVIESVSPHTPLRTFFDE